ncbi:hypothetical protein ACFLUS_04800 [Chloroflexota bacterium]
MNSNEGSNADKVFLLQLHMRAETKAKEYTELLHECQRLEMRIERTKGYLEQLNSFLKAEGQAPVTLKVATSSTGSVGKPGNRSKELPVRKVLWEGMTVNQIIESVLNASPTVSFHPTEVSTLIYEIESEADMKMVVRNVRSTMQRGARDGLWDRTGRAKFRAKATVEQGTLVKA